MKSESLVPGIVSGFENELTAAVGDVLSVGADGFDTQ